MARESIWIGRLVVFGLAARVGLVVVLLAISYARHMPQLPEPTAGNRFWGFAPDAGLYYVAAVAGIEHGLRSIEPGAASLTYVESLAVWMMTLGVHPLIAI